MLSHAKQFLHLRKIRIFVRARALPCSFLQKTCRTKYDWALLAQKTLYLDENSATRCLAMLTHAELAYIGRNSMGFEGASAVQSQGSQWPKFTVSAQYQPLILNAKHWKPKTSISMMNQRNESKHSQSNSTIFSWPMKPSITSAWLWSTIRGRQNHVIAKIGRQHSVQWA